MLVCSVCGSRWNERAVPARALVVGECPLCEGELVPPAAGSPDDAEPVHGDVARELRAHLLGVGA
jgi:hypothetical protein